MEIAIIIVVVTVIAWITGFLKSVRAMADAANAGVTDKADKYVRQILKDRTTATQLTAEELAAAAEDIKRMEEIRSLFR